jgi:ribonuclease-3 family protein
VNAKPHTIAKNATTAEYHTATGLEALMGWLYLGGKGERALELAACGLAALGFSGEANSCDTKK